MHIRVQVRQAAHPASPRGTHQGGSGGRWDLINTDPITSKEFDGLGGRYMLMERCQMLCSVPTLVHPSRGRTFRHHTSQSLSPTTIKGNLIHRVDT